MADEQMYAVPVPYWALNDNQRTVLRAKAAELEATVRGLESRNAPWAERQRVQSELDSVTSQLNAAEADLQGERRRQQGAANEKRSTTGEKPVQSWKNAFGETVAIMANGDLRVLGKDGAPAPTKPVVEAEQEYMPHPTPYFEKP